MDLVVHVPADVLASRREDVEKTLSLAERYCIVSKVVRGNAPALRVTVREA